MKTVSNIPLSAGLLSELDEIKESVVMARHPKCLFHTEGELLDIVRKFQHKLPSDLVLQTDVCRNGTTANITMIDDSQSYAMGFSLSIVGFGKGETHIVLSHETYIMPRFRNRGYSYVLHAMKAAIVKSLGIPTMMAIVKRDNHIAIRSMKHTSWWWCGFHGNDHDIYIKHLP